MVLRSTPAERNHAGNKLSNRYSGNPDEKPVKTQISMRRVSKGMSQLGMKGVVNKQCVSLRLFGTKHRRGNQRFTRLFGWHWRKKTKQWAGCTESLG